MMHELEIDFRGEKRNVQFEHEGDGVILWTFEGENVCSGVDTTQREQDDIYEQLWAYLLDYWVDEP
jgi:hypothetical protein